MAPLSLCGDTTPSIHGDWGPHAHPSCLYFWGHLSRLLSVAHPLASVLLWGLPSLPLRPPSVSFPAPPPLPTLSLGYLWPPFAISLDTPRTCPSAPSADCGLEPWIQLLPLGCSPEAQLRPGPAPPSSSLFTQPGSKGCRTQALEPSHGVAGRGQAEEGGVAWPLVGSWGDSGPWAQQVPGAIQGREPGQGKPAAER